MPIYHDCDYKNTPPSHFEWTIISNKAKKEHNERVKKRAYLAMNQLEGWCTKFKASILIDLIIKTKAKTIVEVGVWGGKSLFPMAYALKELGEGKIYGIDPWSASLSIQGLDSVNREWWNSVDHEAIYQNVLQNIDYFDLGNYITLIRSSSEAASPIENIDLLHIDGNHSEETSFFDVMKWTPMVVRGGLIVFDDTTWGTTAKAVEWLDEHYIRVADYHEDCDWSIWVKP